jgi:hypothetical protein
VKLRSPLVPLVVILLSFGQLIWNGWNATSTIAENLPNPRVSSGLRVVELVHETPNTGRIYDLIFERPATGPTVFRDDARLKIQLSSRGRTRILVLRPGSSRPSRRSAVFDLLRGRARLQVVADRKWVDLGPLPPGGQPLHVQIAGLLPGPFGFAELNQPANPVFSGIRIFRRDPSDASALTTFPRYRVTVEAPVTAAETFARFFFFFSISRVLQVAGVLSLVLLFVGWWLFGKDRMAAAICCLIPSVVLLHAVCLPPLQGADETSHGATIEALLFRGMPVREVDPYPRSWSLAATWLEQDRVQFQPEEPLPVSTPAKREALARNFLGTFQAEAKEAGTPAPAAYVEGVDSRAPFFFRPFSLTGPLLRPLPVIERINAYRVLSTLSGLLFFCAGALLLQRAGLDAGVVLSYGLVWLVPYMVFAVASISNYATAIGLGSLLAACALVLILSERRREKGAAAGLLLAGSWLGIPLWPDFVLLAPVATIVVAIGAVFLATKSLGPARRRFWRAASLASGAAFLLTSAVLLFRIKAGNVGTRMPLEMPRHFDRSVFWLIVVMVAPTIIGALLAFGALRLSRLPADRQRRLLTGASIALATLVLLGFFLTPWTSIPYETGRYSFWKLLGEGVKVALSNSFSWDQDVLFWKFSLGAGGWHDILLPDAIYASSRWLVVAAVVLLPSFAIPSVRERAASLAGLLALAGFAASLSFVTLTIRYLAPSNPFARFMLPWFPLLLTPLLIPVASERSSRAVRAILLLGILLHLWTAIVVVGTRYLFGQS